MTHQPKEASIRTVEDLYKALDFFELRPTGQRADVVQSIGLELLAAGKIEAWELKLLCANLF